MVVVNPVTLSQWAELVALTRSSIVLDNMLEWMRDMCPMDSKLWSLFAEMEAKNMIRANILQEAIERDEMVADVQARWDKAEDDHNHS